MTNEDVTNDDITEAQKLIRELSGGEPYAGYIMPTARAIAAIRKKEAARVLKELDERLQYDGKRNNHYIAPYAWRAFMKKYENP